MAWHRIADMLSGAVAPGTDVTVKGWVRTRRDSKAGLSFVNVSDGSCFDPIQVVAPGTLSNYQADVLRLTTGCAVEIAGTLVPSEGKGQRFEIKAASVRVVGWVEVEYTVNERGATADVAVVAAEPRGVFDEAAVVAVAGWKYRPRVVNGRPVAQRTSVTLQFNVED